MKFYIAGHVEAANVAVAPSDAPKMTPYALSLEILCARLLLGFESLDHPGIGIVRDAHVHSYVE